MIGLTKTAANEINNTTIRDVSIPDGDYLSPSAGGVAGVFYGTLKNTTITNAEVVPTPTPIFPPVDKAETPD